MKKIILSLIIILGITNKTFCQETKFEFTKEGFTDFIVTECDNKNQSELYKKTIEWIKLTYKNPEEVIKTQIENNLIRIEGSSDNLVCFNILGNKSCNPARYLIEISFKDDKYKFDVVNNIEYLHSTGWFDIRLDKTNLYYNKKGIRKNYKYFPEIADYFNNLNSGLKNHILGIKNKKDDW